MEWAPIGPQPTSPFGPYFGYGVDTWAKLSLDVWAVYRVEWAPIGPLPTSPVGSHFGYCVDEWVKRGLGFSAVYWVWSGPQLGPNQQAHVGPTLDMVWIRGLNWAFVSGLFT